MAHEFKDISPNASIGAKAGNWLENRFPTAFDAYRVHMSEYYAPKNFNFWYIFGSLALLVLVIQIVTGIFLVMHYKPDAEKAFASVEYIMRDVPWGWLIRYMHSTGASAFFVVVYLHMFRGLLYGSYRKPRELVWVFGCAIFLCLMAEAFMGYLLPWGQMSYWGAQVIVNLFSAIVFFAPEMGGYFLEYNNFIPADALKTPNHIAPVWYFTPFYSMLRAITGEMMYALSAILVVAAAYVCLKTRMASVLKALLVVVTLVVLALFGAFSFTGIKALDGIDAKFWGVVVMGLAVIILFFLPWLDHSPVKSIRYRPSWHKYVYAVFVVNFVVLAYLGVQAPSPIGEKVSQVGTLFYFGFFLLMPWWSSKGTPKPVPDRITFHPH